MGGEDEAAMTYDGRIFTPDIPGIQVVPAHPTNVLREVNVPRALVIHTPEEPADDYESTPIWFQRPNIGGSTHYYADNDGDYIQCVPDRFGAIANGLKGKPRPVWALLVPEPSLNYQTLSIEVEGYAAAMPRTCPPGSRQWLSVRNWIISRGLVYGIKIDRVHIVGHYELATDRSDPGTLKLDQLVTEAAEFADLLVRAGAAAVAHIRLVAALKPDWDREDFPMLHKKLHYVGVPVAP